MVCDMSEKSRYRHSKGLHFSFWNVNIARPSARNLHFRVFFILSFIFVLSLSLYFISNIYQKWTASPIIIAQNAYATSISEFPFPAVTICNLNQVEKSKIKNVKEGTMESMLVKSLCQTTNDDEIGEEFEGKWSVFREFLLNVNDVLMFN